MADADNTALWDVTVDLGHKEATSRNNASQSARNTISIAKCLLDDTILYCVKRLASLMVFRIRWLTR